KNPHNAPPPPTATPPAPVATTTSTSTTITVPPATTTVASTIVTPLEWGMFAGSGSPSMQSLATTLGKQPDITAIFSPWTDGFPTYMSSVCTSGKTLLIFWEN